MRIIRDLSVELESLVLDDDLVVHADNADVLPRLTDASFDVIYIDPPFNTQKRQTRREISVVADPAGTRTGFGGRRYSSKQIGTRSYLDAFDDYCEFIAPRFEHARRLLADHGTLYFHIDYRETHYCKLLLDDIFGRECFLNEIIWAYDYGARTKKRWPAKHNTILVYVKDPSRYHRLHRDRSRAVHGTGPADRRARCAREAPRGRLVAHDRPDQRA